ncbi:MAG: hypothetical protein SGPRY_000061 [Prymnesium sp.]
MGQCRARRLVGRHFLELKELLVCLVCIAGVGPASARLERLLQSCDETTANEQVVWLQVKLDFYNVEPSNPIELLLMEAEKLKAMIAARLLLLSKTPSEELGKTVGWAIRLYLDKSDSF